MFKGKKLLVVIGLIFSVMLTLVVGCGTSSQSESDKSKVTEITIAGSTSVQPISEVLAQAFMAKHPEIKVNVQGGGSTAGIQAAKTGTANIGSSSRELKSEEKGLVETMICKDGIAVVVNPKNEVKNLTIDQIRKIYKGEITNWKQVGGADKEINVVTREAGSGTRGAFEELVMGKDNPISSKAIVQNSTGAVRTTVAGDVNAIGYVSLASLNESVKALSVDGVEPTVENVKNGTYKISRPFLYLTKEPPAGAVKTFIDFVMSPEGQSLIQKEGLVLVK
ncbi:MAG: phosphate ABC transporter substrate-binding protein [Firmicutes bacterium]|nr:phosphate ABC transporter substrate-binding protein [Bacillota bacterium]